jgi:transposase
MAIYCGVDFHPRQHSVSYCDSADGEIHYREFHHESDDFHSFYSQLTGEVIVGLEATGYSTWFEQLLAGLGHQVWLGDAVEVRRRAKRRQKNDRRDAELILDLLLRGEFPRVRLPPPESREVLRLLRYRHRLVRMRTQVKNSLRALALSAGVVKKVWIFGPRGRAELFGLPLTSAMSQQRDGWLELLADLSGRVAALDRQLKQLVVLQKIFWPQLVVPSCMIGTIYCVVGNFLQHYPFSCQPRFAAAIIRLSTRPLGHPLGVG